MDVVGTLLSAAQTLFASLQCSELKELCSLLGYESDLADLEQTVKTIKAVLLDAESRQMEMELTHQTQLWIEELKDALYDVDDLVDEFLTLSRQKKLMIGGKFTQKVRGLFTRFNSLAIARKISKGVKEIRKRLDAINKNHNQFGFKFDSQPAREGREETWRREETCSRVHDPDIIGRQDDVEKIVGRLLNPDVRQDVSCLTIVGIGGLGKTTLAQLIYNHPRVGQEFPLRVWTCISDGKRWDLKNIICKILEVSTKLYHGQTSMEILQDELRQKVVNRKYLLVLDDVWNEDRYNWSKLMEFLKGAIGGSWVIVTTRSRITAAIVGGPIHDLDRLSDEDSWLLFERAAFGQEHEQASRLELDQIGRDIVKQCVNVPLAIRVAGTALYGKGKNEWLSFREVGLQRVMQGANGIELILKHSYLLLKPQLRLCFSYCAMFPKGFIIEKELLINLWIAQGYVIPSGNFQSMEDAADEYLLKLLKRCFFQYVHKDEDDVIVSIKVHDLLHDIVEQVAKDEILVSSSTPSNVNKKIRHLFHHGWGQGTKSLFNGCKIRTYLGVGQCQPEPYSLMEFGTLLEKWRSLRALDLSDSGMRNLPITLGKLLHLRYLNLSWNVNLEVLPNSVAKLYNLQVLLLSGCSSLKELPKDLGKLTNLRVLDASGCESLLNMPRSIRKLSYLWRLPHFVLGEASHSKERGQLADHLEDLKALQNLKGDLHVQINNPQNAEYVVKNGGKGRQLSQYLTGITISFHMTVRSYGISCKVDEKLLEGLKPHPNLTKLKLEWYGGGIMPNWARGGENLAVFLPNLVSIKLNSCPLLLELPMFGKLPKLKFLALFLLDALEYIENTTLSTRNGSDVEELFFPSLERLDLSYLEKLKGWWRDGDSNSHEESELLLPSFPRLSRLTIRGCPNLVSMPLCPNVKPGEISLVGTPNLRTIQAPTN